MRYASICIGGDYNADLSEVVERRAFSRTAEVRIEETEDGKIILEVRERKGNAEPWIIENMLKSDESLIAFRHRVEGMDI